jgi:glycosyltransferase involved in cell wall biosynthesis
MMTFHRSLGFESARLRDRLRNAIAGWLSAAVVTASIERREHYLSENSISGRKLHVIPLGINTDAYVRDLKKRTEVRCRLDVSPKTLLVGAVGHFGPEKGLDIGVRAFIEVLRRQPDLDAKLVVLGDGAPELRSRLLGVIESRWSGRIVLAGYQTNIREWYSAFDVFLHTPRLEAFGLVVIEAMAASLPVVATRVGGVPEIVRHDETGILCDAESPLAAADGLARLLGSQELREQLGARAAEVAGAQYSVSLAAERYLGLYSRLLSGAAVRRPVEIERAVPPTQSGVGVR